MNKVYKKEKNKICVEGGAYGGVIFVVAEVNGGEGALANSLAIRYPASDGESPALLHGVLFVCRGGATGCEARGGRGCGRRWVERKLNTKV
jgi:hypothetical protein